ncbi:MAG: adenosylcobinamide-GDP ribazoletransferase [Thermomicrobiales bacterium]
MPGREQGSDAREWGGAAALGLSFLTIIPTPPVTITPPRMARAVAFFPLVGMGLGAIVGSLGLLLERVLPAGPLAVLLVASSVALTRALHVDGLIDTVDGVFGGYTPQRRLEIMRDSQIGAFGAVAAVLLLLAQYACLRELSGTSRLTSLMLALGLGRWVMAGAIVLFPAARSSGLGAGFREDASVWPFAMATGSATVLALLLRPQGLAAFVAVAALLAGGGAFLSRRLGGLSGDCYGALDVLGETVVLYSVLLTAGLVGETR